MSKEQIEEMSTEIRKAVNGCSSYWSGLIAKHLYEQDYRKQEWISVEDRLPEDTQMCLAYATVYFVPDHVDDCDHCERIIVTKYYKEFGFMDWDVHYWMPLPEAPKMKGGAEE